VQAEHRLDRELLEQTFLNHIVWSGQNLNCQKNSK
jgi:hypothetical protein